MGTRIKPLADLKRTPAIQDSMYGDVLGTSTTYETHILEDDHFYNDWGDPDDTVQFFTIYEGGSNVCTGPSHYLGDNANLDIYFELQ